MTEIKKKVEKVAEEPLKETDTLPSEAETEVKKQAIENKEGGKPKKKKKIIGLMGIELPEGPPGSTHG